MPVIVFASPKGGVGKSTSALLLAQEIAVEGATVSLLDADPNEAIKKWHDAADAPENLSVFGDITEDSITNKIDEESARSQIVIIDLEGSKNLKMSRALGRADLVVIPLKPSQLDAIGAADAIKLVRAEEASFRRPIPHVALFTMTNAAIVTRDHRAAKEELQGGGVDIFDVTLTDRSAFRAIFAYNSMLRDLPASEVSNVPAAVSNAHAFAEEAIEKLRAAIKLTGDAA